MPDFLRNGMGNLLQNRTKMCIVMVRLRWILCLREKNAEEDFEEDRI